MTGGRVLCLQPATDHETEGLAEAKDMTARKVRGTRTLTGGRDLCLQAAIDRGNTSGIFHCIRHARPGGRSAQLGAEGHARPAPQEAQPGGEASHGRGFAPQACEAGGPAWRPGTGWACTVGSHGIRHARPGLSQAWPAPQPCEARRAKRPAMCPLGTPCEARRAKRPARCPTGRPGPAWRRSLAWAGLQAPQEARRPKAQLGLAAWAGLPGFRRGPAWPEGVVFACKPLSITKPRAWRKQRA